MDRDEDARRCNFYAGLLVAGFKRFQEQRQTLLDHLVTDVLPNLPAGSCPRRFVVGNKTDAAILVVSGLILQFLQASNPSMCTVYKEHDSIRACMTA